MMQDLILIRDLETQSVIGTLPEERTRRQTLIFNLEIATDMRDAGSSDDLNDSVNYSLIEEAVKSIAEESEFYLLEKMAQSVADAVLTFDRVSRVVVMIDKPGAPRLARSIAVRIVRDKKI